MTSALLISILTKNQQHFHPVVSFDAAKDKLLPLNFTSQNTELTNNILSDTKKFSLWVNEKLAAAAARYGIGGYGEHRTVYSISRVFDADKEAEEPRRLHLGTDIWGKPHTSVMAPLDGIVHSFAFNNQFGDYGATIILSHLLEGISFYTLFGHLSLNSIKNLQEGDRVEKGDVFAEFGIQSENGSWPPHLHFQIIIDIGDWSGDYPGVCKFSEKEKWLNNCPDPDIILQLNKLL
ncbi:MAG: peptidoglycan DD-metalloendopeptidase family protein [Chitinophagaceae bacterium]|nr:peptidoglycan DD-metalloendopeptidase family protein [Chitinophagaceae bacterium]